MTTAHHWRDPNWRYHDAVSHRTSTAFKRRQDQRRKEAQAQQPPAKPAPNVKPITTTKRKTA